MALSLPLPSSLLKVPNELYIADLNVKLFLLLIVKQHSMVLMAISDNSLSI